MSAQGDMILAVVLKLMQPWTCMKCGAQLFGKPGAYKTYFDESAQRPVVTGFICADCIYKRQGKE